MMNERTRIPIVDHGLNGNAFKFSDDHIRRSSELDYTLGLSVLTPRTRS